MNEKSKSNGLFTIISYFFVRTLIWILAHTVYRIKVINKESVPDRGGALITPNHISYMDAVLLVITSKRPVRFLVHREIYNIFWLKPLLKLGKAIPVAGTDRPKEIIKSLQGARDALVKGEVVCIFPEGQLTRTGNMLKFNQGLEIIMKGLSCPIIPVHFDRIWGSIFSFERGRYFLKIPKVLPYPLTITFGERMPADSAAFAVRNRVMELGADSFRHRLPEKLTLPEAFWKEARKHPLRFCMADSSGKRLNYFQTLTASVVLSDLLRGKLGDSSNIGVLVPPSAGGVLTNIALSILGKCPVNLNYTASVEVLDSIQEQCDMKYVVTSRKFLEKINIDVSAEKIYLEDLLASVPKRIQWASVFKAAIYPSILSHRMIFGDSKRNCDDLATIMFTSGSTGEPKGVMLSHANILSNLEGLYQVFHVNKKDVVLGVLPLFHSFGFTATMWFPLISGIGAAYHVNPLDAKVIGKMAAKHKATMVLATPTFLNSYIKRCTPEQFASLRLVVVGAEKLKEQVSENFKEKFGIIPMEGYGCTELSPIVSISLPDYRAKGIRQKAYKPGKIGLPLPGIAVKVVDQQTGALCGSEENGLLYVKGPNVMLGYLNKPDLTSEVIENGWYKTGDIANLDVDGFLMITDRLSRFSKIAGEMVPHIKIEEKIQAILQSSDPICAVTSVPDEKKGERLVVLHRRDVNVLSLMEGLKSSGLPNLWIPDEKSFIAVDEIPVLGTGKMDLGAIKRKAQEKLNQ